MDCDLRQDVVNAKLAQRRRMKKSTDVRSCSSSSSFSTSSSSGTSSIKMPMKVSQSGSVCSVGSLNRAQSNNTNVFNFNAKRVEEYLSSLSSSGEDSSTASPIHTFEGGFGNGKTSSGFNNEGETPLQLSLPVSPRKRKQGAGDPVPRHTPHPNQTASSASASSTKSKRSKKLRGDVEISEKIDSNHCDQRKIDEMSVMTMKCDNTREESVPSAGPLTRSKKRKLESDSNQSDDEHQVLNAKRKFYGKERNRRKTTKRCPTIVVE